VQWLLLIGLRPDGRARQVILPTSERVPSSRQSIARWPSPGGK